MLLWVKPLSLVPMWIAYFAWISASAACLALACRPYVQGPAILLVLVSPPIVYGLATGQVSPMMAAMLLWACGNRNRVIAGITFGVVASIKPQLVLLAPLLLCIRRDWNAFAAAAAIFVVLVGSTFLLFGVHIWTEWFNSMANFQAVLVDDNVLYVGATPAAVAKLWGLPSIPFLLVGAAIGIWLIINSRSLGPVESMCDHCRCQSARSSIRHHL